MKICTLICGLKRYTDLVINNIEKLFCNDSHHFIISIDNKKGNDEGLDHNHIIKKIFTKNIQNNEYNNCINYSTKIHNGIRLIDDGYDLYIIVRSDINILHIDMNDVTDHNRLYFSNKNINENSKNNNRINDNIVITKNYDLLMKLMDLHIYNINHPNFYDINLYTFLESHVIPYSLMDIDYKLILSRCNIIAIAGDSGSGKSTLLKILTPLFHMDHVLSMETDRYHKWERNDINYQTYTHLHPYANHLEKMYEDIYNLKIGNEIYQVDYDHSNGKFTQKEKITSKKNIFVCGLHTMYDNKIHNILDIKIYMDTDRELLKKWKINRDTKERKYNSEKVIQQMKDREKDYFDYIIKQKENADIIIRFYEECGIKTEELKCNVVIQNNRIIHKIVKYIIDFDYCIQYINNDLCIELKNNVTFQNHNVMNIIDNHLELFQNEYYKEIFFLLYLIYNE
jgi:uridine kinase